MARRKAVLWALAVAAFSTGAGDDARAQGGPPLIPAAIVQRFQAGPPHPVNGVFRVSVWRDGQWLPAGESGHTTVSAPKTLALQGLTPGQPVRVRITTHGPGGAQLDAALLDGGAPTAAKGIKIAKLAKADLDVANTHGRTLELTFAPAGAATATLTLHGRIEPKVLPATPLGFPLGNTGREMTVHSSFYRYTLGSAPGQLTIDGKLRSEKLGKPLFTDRQRVDPGHPRGTTFGWVRDDGKTLYVAIDFTADNTFDGDADWFKVYAKTGGTLREFKLSVPDPRWGKAGFTYTDKVAYQHKVYEFAIPFAELGIADAKPGTQVPLAFAGYGTVAAHQGDADIAYDAVHNRYLVVYNRQDDNNSGFEDIWGVFVDSEGNFGTRFEVATGTGINHLHPSVAHDPVSGRFLVVWHDNRDTTQQVYGQFVNADGSLDPEDIDATAAEQAGNFKISEQGSGSGNQNEADVASDPVTGRFLVVWQTTQNEGNDIYGRIVTAATGGFVTSEFPIASGSSSQQFPAVAYEPAGGRFHVVWEDRRNEPFDIYGQVVTSGGDLYDGDGAETAGDQTNPAINRQLGTSASTLSALPSLAAIEGLLLAVWHDDNDNTLYGTTIDSDGLPVDSNFAVKAAAARAARNTATAGDPAGAKFFSVWEEQDVEPPALAYGIGLASDGTPDAGGPFQLAPETTEEQFTPSVAANAFCANTVTVAEETTGSSNTILLTAVVGTCTPAYNLLSFDPGFQHGLMAGGTAGESTTFEVTWWGAALPTGAQLYLDLDKDGTAGNATHGPAGVGFGGDDPTRLAALAGLLTLLLAAWTRRRAVLAGALGLGLLAGGLAACGGGSGGGGGGTEEPPPCTTACEQPPPCTAECITMTEANAEDITPVNGKRYRATVTLPSAGNYAYRYVFTGGTTAPIGVPAVGGTLTVE